MDLFSTYRFTRPKVISAKDVPRNDFRMYDAVPADQDALLQSLDPEMDKFLPMLRDYLTCMQLPEQLLFSSLSRCGGIVNDVSSSSPKTSKGATDDYVWDVFYRRPYSLVEWQTVAANAGTM